MLDLIKSDELFTCRDFKFFFEELSRSLISGLDLANLEGLLELLFLESLAKLFSLDMNFPILSILEFMVQRRFFKVGVSKFPPFSCFLILSKSSFGSSEICISG